MKILIINGPNLNLLGKREKEIYGSFTLEDVKKKTINETKGSEIDWFQSNIEGEIVDRIQELIDSDYEGLIINPAAYSHTSVAIYDALKLLSIPIIEVHISNVYQREDFRQRMLTAKAATAIMGGLGIDVYHNAVNAIKNLK